MFTIEMLPANEGDALWIEYGADPMRHVLIDCGRKTAYREVADRLEAQPNLHLELFVLTHVDGDHITGAVPLLGDARFTPARVKDVWFNGWCHLNGKPHDSDETLPGLLSARQGEYFGALLRERDYPWNNAFEKHAAVIDDAGDLPVFDLDGGMKITLLGPTWGKLDDMRVRWEGDLTAADIGLAPGDYERALEVLGEDRTHLPDLLSGSAPEGPIDIDHLLEEPFDPDESEPNGSSIAFLAEHDGKAVLFAGDAHAPQLASSIRRLLESRGEDVLRLDALKMAHHGSARNNSTELLELLDCPRYLVSTNGTKHHHPDRAALARVLGLYEAGVEFYFNYESDETKPWGAAGLQEQNGYVAHYLEVGDKISL